MFNLFNDPAKDKLDAIEKLERLNKIQERYKKNIKISDPSKVTSWDSINKFMQKSKAQQVPNKNSTLFDTTTPKSTPEEIAHYMQFAPSVVSNLPDGKPQPKTTISPVTGQVIPIPKEQQQTVTNQPAQSALTQEQALQIQQDNALLDTLNNESKINTLLASGAMRGSIDQANMNRWADIQNYNAQGQAMADVRKAMNSKSAGFTPVEYQPIQIPQEFIQAQQLQNQLKTNPIHNINSYGMNIPNNVNNVSTINAKFGGTVNGKPVANGANIAGMFDNLGSRKERRKKSQATFNSLNF